MYIQSTALPLCQVSTLTLSACQNVAGIVGGGTNNARLAGLLRGLGSYYYKEPTMLFLVRIAQGLVHMGKGLFTLNPYHTDNQLASGDSPTSSHHRICSADLITVVVYMISM